MNKPRPELIHLPGVESNPHPGAYRHLIETAQAAAFIIQTAGSWDPTKKDLMECPGCPRIGLQASIPASVTPRLKPSL